MLYLNFSLNEAVEKKAVLPMARSLNSQISAWLSDKSVAEQRKCIP